VAAKATAKVAEKVTVTLSKSLIGRSEKQIKTAYSLGLRKIGDKSEQVRDAVLDGKIRVVSHLVTIN